MYLKIGHKEVGENNPVFIIAELSANHLGDFNLAVETIKAMKESGADAVKMQTYTPDTMTLDCDNDYFKIRQDTVWDGSTFYDLYDDAHMPWEWQPELKKIAEKLGSLHFLHHLIKLVLISLKRWMCQPTKLHHSKSPISPSLKLWLLVESQ